MSDYDRRKFQIEASLDATGVREGAQEAVNAVKGMAAGIKEEGAKGAQGLKPIEDAPDRAAAAMSRSEKSMVASIERATAAMRTGGKAGADYYEVLAKQRGISGDMLKPYIDQLRQAEEAQRKLRQAEEARQQLSKATAGISDKQTAAALRGVPAQFTDIIVSLQGGQAPLTVLLQQGGQLKDMFGGAGQATKALGSYILGLVNPLTLAATAAGVLTYGFYSGAQEAQAFRVSLEKTGYQGGLTVNSLSDMSAAMGKLDGITRGQAVDALILMSAESQVGSDRLQRYTTTALQWEKATGEAAKTVAEGFKKIGEDPVKGVLELNKSMGFLTSATLEQIKSLQEAGRVTDAVRLASDAYDKALADAARNIQANLGVVERSWNGVTGAIGKAINKVKEFGRAQTSASRLADITIEMAQLQKEGVQYDPSANFDSLRIPEKRLATLKAEEIQIQKNIVAETNATKAKQISQDREAKAISLSQEASKYYDKETRKRNELLAADAQWSELAKTDAEAAKKLAIVRAGIEEKYKEKGGGKPANTAPATRRLDLSEIQNEAREQVRVIEGQQKDLERLRQSGLIDDDSYYAQRRALIEQTSKVEEGALQEQITRLGQEKSTGVDALAVKKQIADTESKLAAKRLETGEKLKALNFEETQAIERQRIAMETLAQSHKRALEQMERQQQRTISTAWMGSKDRQRSENLWGIEERYLTEQRRLEDKRMFTQNLTPEMREQIDQRLADLQVEKDREIAIHRNTYDQLEMLQSKWELGANFAMQNYADQAANIAQQSADAFANAFRGMEDALVTFVTTGKLSFSSLANSIVADITRIIIKQQISNAMGVGGAGGAGGGWLGSLIGMGANAFGGTSAVATMASAMPGDALSNFIGMMPGLATGGYAGEGGKHEPMGLYHGGEYVINAENTKRIGLGMLDRLNSGGKVPVEALRGVGAVEQAAPASKAQAAVFNINIPVQGGVDRRTKGQIASEAARALSRVERMR